MKTKFTHYSLVLLIALFAIPMIGMPQMKKEKNKAHVCASKECKHDKKPHVCKSNEQHEAFWRANPEAHKAFLQEQKAQKQLVSRMKAGSSSRLKAKQKYIIPVVFHVFGNIQSGKPVTYALLEDALRRTNEDFAQQSVGQDKIHPRFQNVLDNISVEFRLAKKEANGNICDGVNFYPEQSGFGNGGGYDTEIQKYAWDNNKYMNVYIMNDLYDDGDLYNSGVAWYPTQWMTDQNLARVVFNGAYIGDNGSENFRRILTHEFGHFFNLIHTFEGGCPETNGGDQCADTPAATKSQMGVDELNCHNEYTNTQNFMNYSDDYEMFTIDQVMRMTAAMEHSSRIPLWQPANLIATGVNDGFVPGSMLVKYNAYGFKEDLVNDGSIVSNLEVSLTGGAEFANVNFVEGVHFTTSNLPAGLQVVFTRNSNTSFGVRLESKALSHNKANSVTGMAIELLQPAFVTPISEINNTRIEKFTIDFRDEYVTKYMNLDVQVDDLNTWKWFTLNEGNAQFGAWRTNIDALPNVKFKLETYKKATVCQSGTNNIVPLNYGDQISTSSSWYTYDAYPNQPTIYATDYTAWLGKKAYIGFQMSVSGDTYNGWMSATVSADGSTFTLHEAAYYTKPNGTILAGKASEAMLDYAGDFISENAASNNGSMDVLTAKLFNAEFTVGANTKLTNGVHYSISGVPSGLTEEIKVLENGYLSVGFTGVAASHNKSDGAALSIQLKDALFNGLNASEIKNASHFNFNLKFIDPYTIVYTDINNITVNASYDFEWFKMDVGTHGFGAWWYNKEGRMKFETYENYAICYQGTSNLIPLSAGSSIGTNSVEWYQGKDYPNEPDLDNPGFHEWLGKEAYVGVRLKNGEFNHFGWIRIAVAADAMSYTVLDYAFNEQPNGTILAGQKIINPSDDTEAPTAPTNLVASEITQTSVRLDWNASTDNVAVTGYEIESAGLVIASSATNSAVVSGLVANTDYTFTVKAKDSAGNISALSAPVSFKTLSGNLVYCPMVGQDYSYEWITEVVLGSFTKTSAVDNGYGDFTADIISAQAGASLNVSLTPNNSQYTEHWKVWIDYNGNGNFSDAGEEVFSGSANGATTGSINIPADATGSTRLRVAMRYNNAPVLCENPNSGEVEDYTINFEGAPVDLTPPTVPGNLRTTSVSQTSISLAWTASTDDNGIKSYEVLRSGTVVSTGTATSATINNLSPSTSYSFTVRAIDPSENVSNESAVLNVTTLGDLSYCDASGSNGPEHIANVSFVSINNSSTRDPYRDYTAMSANVSQGNTYPITVTIGDYYNGDRATVWFDWNQDGIFNSAEEQLILTTNGAEASGSVIVPVGASLGSTRMRVRVHYYESGALPCHVQTYGEVEDYTIHVSGSAQNMTKTKSLESVDMMSDSETQVKLYPNPVVDHLKIRANDIKNVKVFNVTGKLVLASNNDGNLLELDLNFSELQEGLYLVRIELNNNEVVTKKVVK